MMSWTELQAWFVAHPSVRDTAILAGTLLAALLSFLIARRVLRLSLSRFFKKTAVSWDDVLFHRGVFDKIAWLAPAVIIYASIYFFTQSSEKTLTRLLTAYSIFVFMLLLGSLLTAVNDIYSTTKTARDVPIKGYIQVAKLLMYIAGGVVIAAVVLKKSPWVFLSGLGAATAVLLLVFRDTILSFVASIQIATNDMLRIGDWVQMPKYEADGEVVDVALHTIKIQNWDLTITTIPTFKLIEDSFKNWRGMELRGARRIKRAVYLDQTSITFLDDGALERLGKIQLLAPYLREREQEIADWNRTQGVDDASPVNGRRMTNVGTFRAYLTEYLKKSPRLRQDMTVIVRQLPPGPDGLPVEIYAFAADTAWPSYESLQADIFDHIFAVLPEFGLRVFQNPTGHDLKLGRLS